MARTDVTQDNEMLFVASTDIQYQAFGTEGCRFEPYRVHSKKKPVFAAFG